MNQALRKSSLAIVVGLLGGVLSGCQSGPGVSNASLFSPESLAARRMSAAQQPMARSKMIQAPSGVANDVGPLTPQGVALASYEEGASANPQSAMRMPSPNGIPRLPGPTGHPGPVGYPGPAGYPGAASAPAMPGTARLSPSMPESTSVPREPMFQSPSFVDPSAPAKSSPYQTVSHGRILGSVAGTAISGVSHGDGSCSCCATGRGYRPLFPHKNGLIGAPGCNLPPGGTEVPCAPCETECAPEVRCMDPQEYIYDGGDRDPPVRLRDDFSQSGLDPEDTVIQYTTKTGTTEVQAGCRVAIYAPRFGSVRKRTGVLTSDLALRPQAAILPNGPGILRDQLPPVNVMQPLKPVSKDSVRVVEAFRERQRPLPSELVLPMGVISDAFKPYEDLDIIRFGDLLGTDPAKLALAAAAARIWTNIDQLQVIIDGQDAVVVTDLQQPREYTLYEYKGARVRICKVASETIANPGDIISFTIRYDNVGDQPVSNLVVTDSLAPRLEYVDASQQSSIAARFSTIPNEAGSSILRWEIDHELKPGEGGFVRFDTKVR